MPGGYGVYPPREGLTPAGWPLVRAPVDGRRDELLLREVLDGAEGGEAVNPGLLPPRDSVGRLPPRCLPAERCEYDWHDWHDAGYASYVVLIR